MPVIELDVEAIGIDQTINDLGATEAQVKAALKSTLTKMASWLRTRSVRGLSKALEVQQKVLRRRLKTFRAVLSTDGGSITVWYGLNPISLISLGARQTRRGVTAGRHKRPGAFIAKGQVFKRKGKSRLPLVKQELDIKDKSETYIEDNVLGDIEFERQFFTVFERELRWRTRD